MNCPNCNAPIADGAAFCGSCGMPIAQQPQQPQPNMQYQQPQMQYQQPNPQQFQQPGMDPQMQQQWQAQQPAGQYAPKGSFVDQLKANPLKIATYVGYFFIFLTSFLPGWVTAKIWGISSSEGLLVSGGGILKLWAFLFFAIAVCGILIEFGSLIPAINGVADKFKKLPYSQFYLPGLAFIIWIIASFTGEFHTLVKSSGVGYGFCMFLNIIGILLVLVRPIMAIIKKQEYWD